MSAPGDFDHLSGTQVSFDDTTSPPQAWVIDEKITEDFQTRTQAEVDEYGALPYAVLKFACHNAADPREKGFMRIYIQIPITGTMLKNSTVRAQQATQGTHEELTVLKSLADQGCSVVPRLLAYNVGQQDGDGCVPGGYINHVVWARVSGTPIDEQVYWDRAREYRDKIRDQFRKLYDELARCGWEPGESGIEKIIYDELTGSMHVSDFRAPIPIDPEEKFTDLIYAEWDLVKRSKRPDWDCHPSTWKW